MSKRTDIWDKNYFEEHQCDATKEGDWYIFKCPLCDYERRYNPTTSKMETKGGDPNTMHKGRFDPPTVHNRGGFNLN